MVVADNSSLEERKCILYRLGRRPVSLFQFLAVIALQELLFRDEALVGRIAIGDNFFGVLCELCVQYRFDGFESAVRHGLKMNSPVPFG